MWNQAWKKITVLSIVLVLALTAAACGGKNENTADTPQEEQQEEQELTVLLDWYPNAVHTFLYAAEKQGYFKEAGLKVNLQVPADTNDALKLLASGKADLALSYQMQVAISRSEGIPIVSVAAVVRHPLNRLFVLEESGIKSPKDLAGKKIGFPSIPLDEAIVDTMVQADGGDPSKLVYEDIGWDLIPALTTKRVDAMIGGYVNHEKLLMEKEGVKLVTFDPSEYGVPDYYELVLNASEAGWDKNQDAIKTFWQAAAKGQQYTVEHPEEALQILLDQQNQDFPLDAEVEKQSLNMLLPLMDAGSEGFGSQSEQSWQSVIDWLKEHKHLEKDVAAKDAFRNLQ